VPTRDREVRRLRDLSPQQVRSGVAAWLGWLFDGLDMHLYTLVATAFVAGFVALVWAHVDLETGAVPILEHTMPASSCAANDCLHVPAGDPSVPAADRVFVPGGAQESAPLVPTF
jgi:hypothetical protein